MAHDDERKLDHGNNRATSDGVIVVAMFAVILVSLFLVRVADALQVAGVVHVLDVLGELLDPVVRRKWPAVGREEK